jgi:putative salt-induced outer membrane protein YdiY
MGSILLAQLYAADVESSHAFSLGLNATRGNVDSTQFSFNYDSNRSSANVSEFNLKAGIKHGEQEKERNSGNQSLGADYKKTIHDDLFWSLDAYIERDEIAGINYRFNLSPGLGYRLYHSYRHELDLVGSVGYELEDLDDDTSSQLKETYKIKERWQIKLSSSAKLWQEVEWIGRSSQDDFRVNAGIGVDTSLLGKLNLRTLLNNKYINLPVGDREQSDLSLMTMLVYTL